MYLLFLNLYLSLLFSLEEFIRMPSSGEYLSRRGLSEVGTWSEHECKDPEAGVCSVCVSDGVS